MKKAVVDLTGCEYLAEIHQRFKDALEFPEYYGNNLDAFWDSLNMECKYEFITIIGSESVKDDLKPTLKKMLEMLEKNKRFLAEYNDFFDYEIIN